MNKKKIIVWITIGWSIFSFTFLGLSLLLQLLSGSRSYTLSDGITVNPEKYFNSIAISQNGNYVVAGTSDGVMLFSRSGPTPLWYYDQGYNMNVVDISYDGNYIVAGSREGKLYLFNKSSSQPMWIYDAGFGNQIIEVEMSSDGARIAVNIYQVGTFLFQKESSIPLWNVSATDMTLSADGNFLAISAHSIFYLYNTSSSVPLWSFSHIGYSVEPAISSTGEYIVFGNHSTANTDSIILFNYLSSTPIWTFETDYNIIGLDISSDGKYIVAGSTGSSSPYYDKVYFFDASDSTPLWEYAPSSFIMDVTLEVSGNGEFVLIGDGRGTISLFHRSSNIPIWSTPYGYWGSISSSGKEIITVQEDKLFFFNLNSPLLIEDLVISYIIIFSFLGVLSLNLLNKRHKRKKLLKEELTQKEDLQKILQYSNRVSKKMVRTVLGIDKSAFDEKISEWAAEFGFKVDEDYIFIDKDELPEFIKELDEKFEEWQDLKKKKEA